MGFEPQLKDIIINSDMNKDRITTMCSATLPKEVRSLTTQFIKRDAILITIG